MSVQQCCSEHQRRTGGRATNALTTTTTTSATTAITTSAASATSATSSISHYILSVSPLANAPITALYFNPQLVHQNTADEQVSIYATWPY